MAEVDDWQQCEVSLDNKTLIRRLLAFAWKFRKRCLQVLLFQLVLLAMGLGGLGLTGVGIDYLRFTLAHDIAQPGILGHPLPDAPARALPVILWLAAGILVLAALRAVLNYLYSMSVAKLVQKDIVVGLRQQIYSKLQQLSFRFYDQQTSGSIINRVTGDVQSVRLFIDGVFLQAIIMILSLAVYIVYMVQIHFWLTVASLLTTPFIWTISTYFSRRLRPAYEENRRLMDNLVLHLSESIQGMQTVKAFAREGYIRDQFESINTRVKDQRETIFRQISVFSPAITFLTQLNLFILLLFGGWLVIEGEIPLGSGLVVFAGLLQQFSGQVSNLSGLLDSIQQSLAGARRVFAIIDAPVEIQPPEKPKPLGRARGAVLFENVSFQFSKGLPALTEIDLTVEPGEKIAVVGATGSGKSALMSLIPRFYDPSSGVVRVDGIDVRELHPSELRRNIGVVFQENFLFSNTVAANIAFGHPDARREVVERAARIAQADDFIRELPSGYDTVLEEAGGNLSGGQRQRLAIARALLLDPPILLLDDPTAAIDAETEEEILAAMEQAMQGRTTFMVAHRLSTLRRADRVIVLERGRLVQQGTHEELVRVAGPYREAASLQMLDPVEWRRSIRPAPGKEGSR
ncbi:MAG: ABC transporter ATP-binding protein [Oceanipulchritudo sp.]